MKWEKKREEENLRRKNLLLLTLTYRGIYITPTLPPTTLPPNTLFKNLNFSSLIMFFLEIITPVQYREREIERGKRARKKDESKNIFRKEDLRQPPLNRFFLIFFIYIFYVQLVKQNNFNHCRCTAAQLLGQSDYFFSPFSWFNDQARYPCRELGSLYSY